MSKTIFNNNACKIKILARSEQLISIFAKQYNNRVFIYFTILLEGNNPTVQGGGVSHGPNLLMEMFLQKLYFNIFNPNVGGGGGNMAPP